MIVKRILLSLKVYQQYKSQFLKYNSLGYFQILIELMKQVKYLEIVAHFVKNINIVIFSVVKEFLLLKTIAFFVLNP